MSDQVQENQEEKSLQVFSFEGATELRAIIDKNGNPWFVAKDAADMLGYKDTKKAIKQHCRKCINLGAHDTPSQLGVANLSDLSKINLTSNLIPESDLFRLILNSQLETAEKFQDWVVEEVLPAIRKHGYYGQQRVDEAYIPEVSGWYSAEKMAQMFNVPLKAVNEYLTKRGWQTPTINKHGLLGYKPHGFSGKEYGILQDAVSAKGVALPRKIFWKEAILNGVADAMEVYKNNSEKDTVKKIES